jgi:hypothetical protein
MSIRIIDKPKIEIEPDILQKLKAQTEEMGQVVLHFLFEVSDEWGSAMRIWPTTYLFDQDSDHTSDLVHNENISLYPDWTPCTAFSKNTFTLVFSGLPKSCTIFDFEEFCNGSGGEFVIRGIPRNSTDVYYLQID